MYSYPSCVVSIAFSSERLQQLDQRAFVFDRKGTAELVPFVFVEIGAFVESEEFRHELRPHQVLDLLVIEIVSLDFGEDVDDVDEKIPPLQARSEEHTPEL